MTANRGRGLVLVVEDEKPIADLLRLYLTREGFGVQVAAERPELCLNRPDSTGEKIATALFVKVAETLKNASPPFNTDLGIDLVVAALDILRTNMPGFLDPDAQVFLQIEIARRNFQ